MYTKEEKETIKSDRRLLKGLLEKYGKDDVLQFINTNFDDESDLNYFDNFSATDTKNLNYLENVKNFFNYIGFDSVQNIDFIKGTNITPTGNKMVQFYNLLFNKKIGGDKYNYISFNDSSEDNEFCLDLDYIQLYYLAIIILTVKGGDCKQPKDGIEYLLYEGFNEYEENHEGQDCLAEDYINVQINQIINQLFKNKELKSLYKGLLLDNTDDDGMFADFCLIYDSRHQLHLNNPGTNVQPIVKSFAAFDILNELWYDIVHETNGECYKNKERSCYYAPYIFNEFMMDIE